MKASANTTIWQQAGPLGRRSYAADAKEAARLLSLTHVGAARTQP